MHLAEGTLPLVQAGAWTAVAFPMLIWSVRGEQVERLANPQSSVLMAAVTSILFAATLLPLPVPVVGATSHICLTPLFALIVGVRRLIWATCFILLLQALFFAHGGLTTLGVNTLTLGCLGPLFTVLLWSLFRKVGLNNFGALGLACGLGGLGVYAIDALVLGISLSDEVNVKTTVMSVLVGFAPVQIPLSILEGFVSVKIVHLLMSRRKDLLPSNLATIRKGAIPASTWAILLIVLGLSGCTYEGIDGTVFGDIAERGGNPPVDSIIDFSQGEMGLAMSIVILFGLGFVAGSSWHHLFSGDHDAK